MNFCGHFSRILVDIFCVNSSGHFLMVIKNSVKTDGLGLVWLSFHLENVHKNSHKKMNSRGQNRENSPKVSTRFHLFCPRKFTFNVN